MITIFFPFSLSSSWRWLWRGLRIRTSRSGTSRSPIVVVVVIVFSQMIIRGRKTNGRVEPQSWLDMLYEVNDLSVRRIKQKCVFIILNRNVILFYHIVKFFLSSPKVRRLFRLSWGAIERLWKGGWMSSQSDLLCKSEGRERRLKEGMKQSWKLHVTAINGQMYQMYQRLRWWWPFILSDYIIIDILICNIVLFGKRKHLLLMAGKSISCPNVRIKNSRKRKQSIGSS